MNELDLTIVTPDGYKLQQRVDELTAPSVEGEFGVLPGHRPLLAALKTGIVKFRSAGVETPVAVGPGFVEIGDDKALILTDRFSRKEDVDPVVVRLALKDADAALDKFVGDPASPEYRELIQHEQWAAVQLELYGDPPPPTVRGPTLMPPPSDAYRVVQSDADSDS